MHSWEMINDYNSENLTIMPIKSEPIEPSTNSFENHQHSSTSPKSLEGSISPPQNMFYPEPAYGMSAQQIRPLGFNPLTPPGYPNAIIPGSVTNQQQLAEQISQQLQQSQMTAVQESTQHTTTSLTTFPSFANSGESNFSQSSTLTPSHTPPMENGTPPKSPSAKYPSDNADKDVDMMSTSCDESRFMDSGDEEEITTPKVNSHGKVKQFKCKQCEFVAVTKKAFWDHMQVHIKPEKLLKCPVCPFVTEYKHHLEYHLRNHDGSKPFQCDQCNYSCVNKSMLNSHSKSHSEIYRYRCADCSYISKYCHSLKLHLRKLNHSPSITLDVHGQPTPFLIDVYGSRRGPRTRATRRAGGAAAARERKNQKFLEQKHQLEQQHLKHIQQPHPAILEQQILHHQQQHNLQLQQQQHQHQQQQQQQQQQHQHQHQQQPQPQPQHPLASLFPQMIPFANMFPYLNFQVLAAHRALGDISPNTLERMMATNQDENDNQISKISDPKEDRDDNMHHSNSNDILMPHNLSMRFNSTKHDSSDGVEDKNTPSSTSTDDLDERFRRTPTSPFSTPAASKNRRKGRAFKLDMMQEQEPQDNQENTSEQLQLRIRSPVEEPKTVYTSSIIPISPLNQQPAAAQHQETTNGVTETTVRQSPSSSEIERTPPNTDDQPNDPSGYRCAHCHITYEDALLHTIHMGYHGFEDVFKCNICGIRYEDRFSFFLHIAKIAH